MKIAIVLPNFVRLYQKGLGKGHETILKNKVSIASLKNDGYKVIYSK